jgi:hypothetical protein
MKPFESISYKGKTIIIVDISNTKPNEAIVALQEAQQEIAKLPPKSALILTDATNAIYNKASSAAMKEFAAKNTPFVKASAVVGADGIRAILLEAVRLLTRREIKACESREEAMEWLVSKAR